MNNPHPTLPGILTLVYCVTIILVFIGGIFL